MPNIKGDQINVGTDSNQLVQLVAGSPAAPTGKLPAVDGSQLTNLPAGGISNVIEDTTPQLGGNLDVNANSIIGADFGVGSGPGGAINITAGAGGTTGGNGGAINITSGYGTSYYAGNITIKPGQTNYNSSPAAQTIIEGGQGLLQGGGSVFITGGAGGNAYGGDALLRGGTVTGGTNRASVRAFGARDNTIGGNLDCEAGSGAATNYSGGKITLTAGAGGTGGGATSGGDVSLVTGDGKNGGADGAVTILGGTGTTVAPSVRFFESAPSATNYVALKAPDTVSTDAVWTIPAAQNTSGDPLGIDLGEYTLGGSPIANIPSASLYPNCWALVTDFGSPAKRVFVRSDGTNWKYAFDEGVTVV